MNKLENKMPAGVPVDDVGGEFCVFREQLSQINKH